MPDDDQAAPLPAPMWLPFALLGAAASFFCVLGIAVVMTDARFTKPLPAVVTGAIVGGAVGVSLRRWRKIHDPWLPQERQRAWIALVVMAAGGIIGSFVTWYTGETAFQAGMGGISGVVCALLFVPGAVFMVHAASNATRARNGSIVAGADRRSIWSTTLAAIAVAPVVAVPATAVGLVSFSLGPMLQPAVLIGASLVALAALAVLEIAERKARARLERIASRIEELEPAVASDAASARAADLGLGDVAFSTVQLRDAYRGARHAEIAVRGDPDEARQAIDDAWGRRRRARTLGIVALLAALPSVHALAVRYDRLDTEWDPTGVAGVFDLELRFR